MYIKFEIVSDEIRSLFPTYETVFQRPILYFYYAHNSNRR
ncbi:hypothetical protein LEP1GSC165_1983 [Leptospira santarosai str. CBC523]|nr:hypothetical protein LEP1GSC165_1983 [Leptospira santarosai str. CBC523]